MIGYLYCCWDYLTYNMITYLLTIYTIFNTSFLWTVLTNPGIPKAVDPQMKIEQLPKECSGIQFCKICQKYALSFRNKKKSALHCSTCGVCVESKNYLYYKPLTFTVLILIYEV